MTDRKRLLGLDRSITRRDFVNVAGVGIVGVCIYELWVPRFYI